MSNAAGPTRSGARTVQVVPGIMRPNRVMEDDMVLRRIDLLEKRQMSGSADLRGMIGQHFSDLKDWVSISRYLRP